MDNSLAGDVLHGEGQKELLCTYSLKLAYRGTPFSGFARQPEQLTVQGNLEEALSLLFKQDILTVCAGRTDAGVHAREQVVSFSVPHQAVRGRQERSLVRSLNALTHEQVVVKSIEQRAPEFSARFDAVSREYRYFISTDTTPPLFMRDFSWHVPQPLDVCAMKQAACFMEGEHDFKSFCVAASAKDKSTYRFVEQIKIEQAQVMSENMLVITVKGNAFLHSMVRTMVGTLVKVGAGHREPEWVQTVLQAKNRAAAGETAPACGLVLWAVDYEGERCAFAPLVQRANETVQAANLPRTLENS